MSEKWENAALNRRFRVGKFVRRRADIESSPDEFAHTTNQVSLI